ncbi:hypothetical protein JCM1840_004105 [Sporobolomyces johnsonii]
MAPERPRVGSASGYECTKCCSPVSSLYMTYFIPSNTSLLQCPKCGHLADIYTSFPFPVLLLDLLLLKQAVYRHLLRNRGGSTPQERRWHQLSETSRLGAIVLGVDAFVRCFGMSSIDGGPQPLKLYLLTFGYCFGETVSLVSCISIAAIVLQSWRTPRLRFHDLTLLPLALFYSSLPTIFFLVIASVIWRAEYLATSSSSSSPIPVLDLRARLPTYLHPALPSQELTPRWALYLASFSRANLKSGLAQVGSARGWASEAVLRKGVGGSSAVVAVSVLLRTTKRRAVAVLLLAWVVHLVVLHCIDNVIA